MYQNHLRGLLNPRCQAPSLEFPGQCTWSEAQECAFLRNSQVMLMLLNQGPHFQKTDKTQNWPSYVCLLFHLTIKSKRHCKNKGNSTLLSSYEKKKKNQTFEIVYLHYFRAPQVSKEYFAKVNINLAFTVYLTCKLKSQS